MKMLGSWNGLGKGDFGMGIFGSILNSMEQSMIEGNYWPLYNSSLRARAEDNFRFAQNCENNWERTIYFMAAINRGLGIYDSNVKQFYNRNKSMITRHLGKLRMNRNFETPVRMFMDKIKNIGDSYY